MGNCVKPVDPLIAAIPRSGGIDASAIKDSGLPIIFLVGGPGAGTRTQCAKLAEKYGFLSIISTDLLRDEVSTRSARAAILARLMSEGRLVPPDVLLELIKIKMLGALDVTKGFILSGIPREKEQNRLFDEQVRPPDLVLYLSVRDSVLSDRIMAKNVAATERHEYKYDVIKKRINEFRKTSESIIKGHKKCLVEVDGEQDVERVFQDVCEAIDNALKNVPATTKVRTEPASPGKRTVDIKDS